MKKKLNTKIIRKHKLTSEARALQMLTCYDFQTAQLLNDTILDLILVGDSVGNVVLGYPNTIHVTLEEMIIFSSAVKRGAPDKFVIADLPFGSYSTFKTGVKAATTLFKSSGVEAIKLEGAYDFHLKIIRRLVETGVPVMGHIGLTPQSVHEFGGYYTHGKDKRSADKLIQEALALEAAGCFSIVLECVEKQLALEITQKLRIPTIGIGSGTKTDGQVLVLNDLLKMGKDLPPSFCDPISNFYQLKKGAIDSYLSAQILNLGLNDEKLFINY